MNGEASTYDLAVAGHLCLDIIPDIPDTGARRVEALFLPGRLIDVGGCALSTGGAVSNTGISAVRLGCKVAFIAKVGDDALGRTVRTLLDESGGSSGVTTDPSVSTSYSVVLAPPGIDRMFLHSPGANDAFGSDDIDDRLLCRARIFHLGYPPLMGRLYADEGDELAEIYRRAKDAGATTSLDMALPDPNSPSGMAPWNRILERTLPFVDLFIPSLEEAFFMTWPEEFLARKRALAGAELIAHVSESECSEMAAGFIARGAAMAALKCGQRGYYFRTAGADRLAGAGRAAPADIHGWADSEVWCPAFAADRIASATGSGDASIAGFLAGLLRGGSLDACLRTANCAGLQNLGELDAVSGMQSWTATQDLLAADPPTIDPGIGDPAWHYDETRRLWIGPNSARRANG